MPPFNIRLHTKRVFLTTIVTSVGTLFPALAVQGESVEKIRVESVVLRLLNEADAPARDAGVVTQIKVREGQVVRKGELLAQLDDAEQQLAKRAAEGELAIARQLAENDVAIRYAEKSRETAAAELRRSEESIAKYPRSVSQSQLDVERTTVDKMTLEREQAVQDRQLATLEITLRETELAAARLRLDRRQIVAPIDGVVVEVATRIGQWLEPGQKAMRLINTDRLKAEGFISADTPTRELVGREVWLRPVADEGRSDPIVGRVMFVSPEIDPINNEVRFWAEVDNRTGELRPGQKTSLIIRPDTTAPPTAAVSAEDTE